MKSRLFSTPSIDKTSNALWLSATVSLWITLVANVGFWKDVHAISPFESPRQWAFGFCLGVIIFSLNWLVSCLFSFRPIVKWWLSLQLIAAAICSYFILTYGVVIDEGMIVNSLQTDAREVRDLLSAGMALSFALIVVPGLVYVWRKQISSTRFFNQLGRNLGCFALATLLLVGSIFAMFQDFSSLMRNNTALRHKVTPVNAFWGLGQALSVPLRRGDGTIQAIGDDAKQSVKSSTTQKPKLIIYIVGETARSINFSLNGYERNTNPKLSKLDVVSFTEVSSCGTATAASLPCMFSALGREAYTASKDKQEGLLDVLKKAGIAQHWRNNNSGCKGVCDRISVEDVSRATNARFCTSAQCFDEILLDGLNEKLKALSDKPTNTMLTLHQLGSHGPAYYLRSPSAFKTFTPECETNQLQQCSKEQIVNAYDNTIVYTDHLIAQSINWLQSLNSTYDTALVYVSDHGESLGEGGTYLHGLPYTFAPKVQKHVPLIVWLSDSFASRLKIDKACLNTIRNKPLSHDNLFHSMLFLNEVETSLYLQEQNLFAQCAK
jgi:lipid A ethanolaminephosphotransferase